MRKITSYLKSLTPAVIKPAVISCISFVRRLRESFFNNDTTWTKDNFKVIPKGICYDVRRYDAINAPTVLPTFTY